MSFERKIKKLARHMIKHMTHDERDFILFIHLCDHLEQDEELFEENWSIMEEMSGEGTQKPKKKKEIPMEDIFPAVYERLGKKP
jgi:hypothetical protein